MNRPLIGSLIEVTFQSFGLSTARYVTVAQATSMQAAMAVERLLGAPLFWAHADFVTPHPELRNDRPTVAFFPQREAQA